MKVTIPDAIGFASIALIAVGLGCLMWQLSLIVVGLAGLYVSWRANERGGGDA